jgi:CBS domain containing-hemolysin-like protein
MEDGDLVHQLVLVGLAALLVLLNGFFVAAEFAMVKVRPTRIEELVREGNRRARIARHIHAHLYAYLSATQVGVTITSLGLGWIGEPAVARLLRPTFERLGVPESPGHGLAFVVAFTIISFFHIVIGELGPKSVAIQRTEKTALHTALPLRVFYIIMWPAIALLTWAANRLLRALGLARKAAASELAHTAEELRLIVEASGASGELNPHERKLLDNALVFSERLVREIMVPRPDMVCLYKAKSLEENLAIVREARHTRYPLASDDKDHVVGMIHVRDLVDAERRARSASGERAAATPAPAPGADGARARPAEEEPISLEKLRRPILFVPAVATLDRVLRLFQRGRSHLAVVVDEYGGIAGLVTLEDVLEELVGEIHDEFDVEEDERFEPGAGGELLVDAGLPLEQAARSFRFEPTQATVDTIGGYVLQLLGRLPKIGEWVQMGRYRVEVAEMDGLRLTRLRFKPLAESKSGRAPAPGPDGARRPA